MRHRSEYSARRDVTQEHETIEVLLNWKLQLYNI